MILRQILHTSPTIAASYIFGCGSKSVGAVVDPVSEPHSYLKAAADLGLRIRYVMDTHIHADHLSTGRALAAAAAASYVLHESVDAEFDFQRVDDGDRLELGNTVVDIMHLPGHTPEHIGLLVTDRVRSEDPWFVITGHTLMVGDMGRTELASSAEAGARALFESARKLKRLPDHIEILPGAFAGSVCGRALSGKPMSTIGFERRFNKAFSIEDRDTFVDAMTRDIPAPPPNAAENRARNLGTTLEAGSLVAVS
ncbi:MAG TPA: MBL fold metallo-hydrolase [Gemmatimonadaceae bacterium]|nr:MBL fold metallo-hydrolase [Gemmatimonadaceae bacterium]